MYGVGPHGWLHLAQESRALEPKGVYLFEILCLVFAETSSLPLYHKLPGECAQRRRRSNKAAWVRELFPRLNHHPFQLPSWGRRVHVIRGDVGVLRGAVGVARRGRNRGQGDLIQLGNFSIKSFPDQGTCSQVAFS